MHLRTIKRAQTAGHTSKCRKKDSDDLEGLAAHMHIALVGRRLLLLLLLGLLTLVFALSGLIRNLFQIPVDSA